MSKIPKMQTPYVRFDREYEQNDEPSLTDPSQEHDINDLVSRIMSGQQVRTVAGMYDAEEDIAAGPAVPAQDGYDMVDAHVVIARGKAALKAAENARKAAQEAAKEAGKGGTPPPCRKRAYK